MQRQTPEKISSLLTLLVVLIIVGGCSTKKNTFTRRVYHNLTAHYNAFFNGEQALIKGVNKIEEQHSDNFNKILPVFRLADEKAAQSVIPKMDRAIKKAAKVVRKHSMEFHGREYNNWIDDAYLLMGKAHFYKREYLLSKRLFNYVISKYHSQDLVYEAMCWKALVDVIRNNYKQALNSLAQVKLRDRRGRVSNEAQRLYPRIYAQLYIDRGNYEEAIEWVDKAIEENRDKDICTRMMFIKAQIYQKNEQLSKAAQTFQKVIENNPSYDLVFYSKINIAQSYQVNQSNDYNIRTELKEMLKDAKNKEYKDVIYYALAEIALKEGNRKKGMDYLRKSVSKSVNNNRQKAISSLELGELFFDQKDYKLSQAYYDTAFAVLPKNYPNYEKIKNKTKVLSGLVNNLMEIERQDSLQRIANMDKPERDRFINELIQEVKKRERQKRREERRRQNARNEARRSNARNQRLGGGSGEWYFYNNQAKSFGFNEFKKIWGDRELEDNWRLSNKSKMEGFAEGREGEGNKARTDSAGGKRLTKKDKEYYLRDLPMTDSAMAASDSIIKKALFELGLTYQEELENYSKAVESHETLIDRYPKSKYTLQCYFHLYNNHEEIGNTQESKEYKQLILKNYPESDYAKFIENPDYFKKKRKKLNKAEQLYEKAWKNYKNGNYSRAKTVVDTALNRFGESDMAPKFTLLKAFTKGHISDSTAYVDALNHVVKNYKGTPQGKKASKMLAALKKEQKSNEKSKSKKGPSSSKEKGYYTYQKNKMQLYIAVFSVKNLSVNDLKVAYSDYNNKFQSLKDLSVNSVYLDNKHQMLTVSRFKNAEEGLRYYRGIINNEKLNNYFKNHNGKHFLISVNDYSKFYKDKNVKKYKEFFKKNYLGKK